MRRTRIFVSTVTIAGGGAGMSALWPESGWAGAWVLLVLLVLLALVALLINESGLGRLIAPALLLGSTGTMFALLAHVELMGVIAAAPALAVLSGLWLALTAVVGPPDPDRLRILAVGWPTISRQKYGVREMEVKVAATNVYVDLVSLPAPPARVTIQIYAGQVTLLLPQEWAVLPSPGVPSTVRIREIRLPRIGTDSGPNLVLGISGCIASVVVVRR